MACMISRMLCRPTVGVNLIRDETPVFCYRMCSVVQKCRFAAVSNDSKPHANENAEDLLNYSVIDFEEVKQNRNWSSSAYPPGEMSMRNQAMKRREPEHDLQKTVVLFPGQGSQYLGMGKDARLFPEAKYLFDIASNFLGYDLLELCATGPKDKLDRTEFSQLAVFVLSLASVERLRHEKKLVIDNCVATAGFSLGEISALVFAEAVSFMEALKLVKIRAEAMQEVCNNLQTGMISVLYGHDSKLEYACLCARQWCLENGMDDPECRIATYLFPECKVIAGHLKALEFLENNASKFNLKVIKRLPVSGAFHTPVMKPAAESFKKELRKTKIMAPRIPVYSNVDGKMYKGVQHILKQLPQQIFKPVKWEQTLHILYERNEGVDFPYTIECGPGSSLKTCLKKVNAKAWKKCTSVEL